MINQTIIVSLVAFATGAAGFFVGRSSSSDLDTSKAVRSSSAASIVRGVSILKSDSKRRDATRGQAFSSSSEVFEQDSLFSQIEDLIRFYKTLDTDELAAEADKLEKLHDEERSLASYLLFAQWAEIDPLGAITKTESGSMGGLAKVRVLNAWASIDPHSAAEYYKDSTKDPAMSAKIALELAEKDPTAALSWSLELGGKNTIRAVDGVFLELGESDPDKAAQLALNLDKELRDRAYRAIGYTLDVSGDYSEVEAWISGLPLDGQSIVRTAALRSLANKNPEGAVQQLDVVTDPKQKLSQIGNIARGYTNSGNAAAGVVFLVEIGSQKALENSIDRPMRSWISDAPEQARDYVLAMPSGQVRDTTLKSYLLEDSDNDDYAGQLDLAVTIENETKRGDAYNELMKRFLRGDENSARAYLAKNSGLTEEQQKEIIRRAKR